MAGGRAAFFPGSLWSAHPCVCWFDPGGNSKAEGGEQADMLPGDSSAPPTRTGLWAPAARCWLLLLCDSKPLVSPAQGQTPGKLRATRHVVLLAAGFSWKPGHRCDPRLAAPRARTGLFIPGVPLKSVLPCMAMDLPGRCLTHAGTDNPSSEKSLYVALLSTFCVALSFPV